MRIVVFSDLDGTLLDHRTYSFEAAKPALRLLKDSNIPLVLVSSKTASELWSIREELDNEHPFVCENGSVVFVPESLSDYAASIFNSTSRVINGYFGYYRGANRSDILAALSEVKEKFKFTGFSEWTAKEIADVTGLPLDAAELAADRMATEPIIWRDADDLFKEFSEYLTSVNLRVIRGGRFYHVMGRCDKGDAVREIIRLYERAFSDRIHSIGLGDGPNDLEMLRAVDAPILMPDISGKYLDDSSLEHVLLSQKSAPEGWNEMVNQAIDVLVDE